MEIHPICLEFELASNELKIAECDLRFVIKAAKEKNREALFTLSLYKERYDYALNKYNNAKRRFISIGGNPNK